MKVLVVSLGCDKNLVDSEGMLALLKQGGYELTNEEQEAEVAIVNTCCFIHDAKEESIQTILELAGLKQKARLKKLIVTGCLAQRYQKEIQEEIPEVDAILGSVNPDDILCVVERSFQEENVSCFRELGYLPEHMTDRLVTTGTATAYLKIAEGCSKRCTYCIIPYLRGNYRSIPMEEVLETASKLAEQGYQELVLVAQETTVYGKDLYGEKRLPALLTELSRLEGIRWIRLLYCYPEEITEELIRTMAENKKICHYIDMPIQHCDDRILKAMGRKTSQKQIRQVVKALREAMPDIVIRTTLITGFPGENENQHQALLEFIDEMEFERLGVFPYSQEEGTPAADFPDQVEEEIKKRRQRELMELQQEVSYDNNQRLKDTELEVLIEGYLYEEGVYLGRSYREAPEVDGCIFVSAQEELVTGDMVKVRITEGNEYDLMGEVIYEFTE